jgi:hypothetical protein
MNGMKYERELELNEYKMENIAAVNEMKREKHKMERAIMMERGL